MENETRALANTEIRNKLTQDEYFKLFKQECEAELLLTTAKNSDYAGKQNAFKNFEGIEWLTNGKISTEYGIIVRLSDKFQRIINLMEHDAFVKSESILDTLRDISVYSKILRIYIMTKNENQQSR